MAIGDVQMELVPSPVVSVPMTIFLASQVALSRQFGQHFREFHASLPLQARVWFRMIRALASGILPVRPPARTFLASTTFGGLDHGLARGLSGRFGVAFAGFNGGGIAGDVADEALLLGLADERFVDKLGEFHEGELGEGPGEGGFMRYVVGLLPAADAAQWRVAGQSVEELAGERKSVDGFGDEGVGDGQPVFGGASDPASAGGDEAGQGDHFEGGDQAFGGWGEDSEFILEEGKELGLQDVSELRELLSKSKLQKGPPWVCVCMTATAYP